MLEQRTVGPGSAPTRSARAPSRRVAFAGIIGFMVLVYGFFGIVASVALVMNMVLTIALLSLLGATLTMPGIAGLCSASAWRSTRTC